MVSPLPSPSPPTHAAPAASVVYSVVASPVGDLTLTGTAHVLTGCWFEGPLAADRAAGLERDDHVFAAAAEQLAAYFSGRRRHFDLPLGPHGTAFQQRVWMELRAIPYGETRTYGQIAAALGSPGASRAVGLANGRNPLPIIVPCHRVIGSDGSLTGFAGGMDRKRFLLDHEQGVDSLL